MTRYHTPRELRIALDAAVDVAATIALLTHTNPDGDGFAACLAVQELLRQRGRDADIILERPCVDIYDYIEGRARSMGFTEAKAYDLVVVLDCHERKRLGVCAPIADLAKRVIVADHHEEVLPIDGADVYIDAGKVCIGAVVFQMYEDTIAALPDASRRFVLEALYTTILNDTDNYANLNTNAEVFGIAARMCEMGLIPSLPVREFIFRKTVSEVQFLGETLATSVYRDGFLFVHSTLAMLRERNLPDDVTSGVTRWLKGTRGIKLLCYAREKAANTWRVSLRADEIPVNTIANRYGGGGHERAAGFDFQGTLDDLEKAILAEVKS